MSEKKRIVFYRIIFLTIILVSFFLPSILTPDESDLELLDSNVIIEDYSDYFDESTVSIELAFNYEINSGYVTIAYYDQFENLLEIEETYCYSLGEYAESYVLRINGAVDSFEIIDYDFDPVNYFTFMYLFLILAIPLFIDSLFLSYKEYFYNGIKISVYAGFFHHTLRINGIKQDEHSAFFFIKIFLSTSLDGETLVEAKITSFNRIVVKVNGKMIRSN